MKYLKLPLATNMNSYSYIPAKSLTSRLALALITGIALLTASACSTMPSATQYEIPISLVSPDHEQTTQQQPEHYFQPNDTLEILYRYNTTSNNIYRIAPHDKVSIKFLTAPEYDDIHIVGPDGMVSLPFIGSMQLAGKSTNEITADLIRAYEPILKEPSFFVSVKEFHAHLAKLQELLDHPNYGQGRVLTVGTDYLISLPLIGSLNIEGKNLVDIRTMANSKYQAINPNLQIDLFVHKLTPRNLYVMGEVLKPGAYRVDKSVSLFEALALSGGASRQAQLSSVLVLRQNNDKIVANVVDLAKTMTGQEALNIHMIQPNDVIYVPRTKLAKSSDVMRQVGSLFLFNGFGFSFSYRVDDRDEVNLNGN